MHSLCEFHEVRTRELPSMNQSQHPRCFLDPLIKRKISVSYHSSTEENGSQKTEYQEFKADENVDDWKFDEIFQA